MPTGIRPAESAGVPVPTSRAIAINVASPAACSAAPPSKASSSPGSGCARIRRQAFSTPGQRGALVTELLRKQRASKVGLRRVIYVAGPTWRPGHGKATAAIADPFRHPGHVTLHHVIVRSVTAGRSVTFASAGKSASRRRPAGRRPRPRPQLRYRVGVRVGGHQAQNLAIGPGRANGAGTKVARRVHLGGRLPLHVTS